MEYLAENLWAAWIAVGIFFLVIELCTAALVSIWFVPAAGITSVLSLIIPSLPLQIVIFVVLSGVFMLLFKKLYKNKIKKPIDEVKAETKIIGKTAITVEKTNKNGGRVKLGDVYWRAITKDGSEINKDETVIITDVEDTTLVIEKQN